MDLTLFACLQSPWDSYIIHISAANGKLIFVEQNGISWKGLVSTGQKLARLANQKNK